MASNRVPKRLVYCSDGVLEEFSSDSDTEGETHEKVSPEIDPTLLPWAQWAVYCAKSGLSTSVKIAEYVGERIADFTGITAPVYKYEIEEYYRMKEEESRLRQEEAEECRTRAKEHSVVASSNPYFISMSNERTKLNAGTFNPSFKLNSSCDATSKVSVTRPKSTKTKIRSLGMPIAEDDDDSKNDTFQT